MDIREPELKAYIEPHEPDDIRAAIRTWGKPDSVVNAFCGARLGNYLGRWKQFLQTDWANWDISEYDHDLGCRYWLQLILENVGADSKARILSDLDPLDQVFKSKMKPSSKGIITEQGFKGQPYFWETNTIHPELWMA